MVYFGNEAFEKMATFGLLPNLTLYLMNEYPMEMMTGANVLFMWSAATNFMPLIGAFIADSYLGRYHTIGFGSIICLMGVIQLWSTTIIPHVRPPPCDQSSNVCSPPTTFQFLYLCMSLGLISIGAGAIRSSSLAFGADKLEKRGFHKNPGMKQTYFGWSSSSLITGFVQVAVASYRNRHLKFSEATCYQYHCKNGLGLVFPNQNLSFAFGPLKEDGKVPEEEEEL